MKKNKFIKSKYESPDYGILTYYRLHGMRTEIPSLTFLVLDRLDIILGLKQISRGYQAVMSILEPDEF
jgi:hypothetical protein